MKYVKGSETSKAAALSVQGIVGALRVQIAEAFLAIGPMTCDQVETLLDLRHQTASARVCELAQGGWIEPTGEKRPTRSGRAANVYRVTRLGHLCSVAANQRKP